MSEKVKISNSGFKMNENLQKKTFNLVKHLESSNSKNSSILARESNSEKIKSLKDTRLITLEKNTPLPSLTTTGFFNPSITFTSKYSNNSSKSNSKKFSLHQGNKQINNFKSSIKDSYMNNFNLLTKTDIDADELRKSYLELSAKDRLEMEEGNQKVDQFQYEKEIKKLNHWDVENLMDKQLKLKMKQDSTNKEVESINWVNEMKIKLSNLNISKINPNIQKFLRKMEMDEKAIFLQNISISKAKFNFDVFCSEKNSKVGLGDPKILLTNMTSDAGSKKLVTSTSKVPGKFDIENYYNTTEEIKNDVNYELLSSIDFYREVIKAKMKQENESRRDIMRLSKNFYVKKVEKMRKEKLRLEVLHQLNVLREEFQIKRDRLESDKTSLQKMSDEIFGGDSLGLMSLPNLPNLSRGSVFMRPSKKRPALDPEQFRLQSELVKKIYKLQEDLVNLNKSYKNKKETLEIKLTNYNLDILNIEKEIKYLKNDIDDSTEDQKNYYFDRLRLGYDVRWEGLTWIVKRLIELNSIVEPSHFPRFLDYHQIDYIMKFSAKTVETNQLKIILKTLKNRQRKARHEITDNMMRSTKTFFNNTGFDFVFFNQDKSDKLGATFTNSNVFSHKTLNNFRNIFNKYEEITKNTYEQKLEEITINKIVDNLKGRINKNKLDEKTSETMEHQNQFDNEGYCEEMENGEPTTLSTMQQQTVEPQEDGGFVKFLLENSKEKEHFQEVLILRDAIQKNDEELEKMKNDMMKNFKKHYEIHKQSKTNSIEYEIVYSALFGNGTTL
jgi:hypothetical protein